MSKLDGITQEQPGGNSWTIWRRFLKTICREQYIIYEPTSTHEETEQQFSNGTIITKYWDGVPYLGQIVSKTDKYYKIFYEDGDEEELNSAEVNEYMEKNRGEGGVFPLDAAVCGTLLTKKFDSNTMRDGSRQENYFENN